MAIRLNVVGVQCPLNKVSGSSIVNGENKFERAFLDVELDTT